MVGALGARLAAWDFETGLQFVFTAAFAALLVRRGARVDHNKTIAHLQAVHYPHLSTVRSGLAPAESFGRAAMVGEELGWRIVHEAREGSVPQATDTTVAS